MCFNYQLKVQILILERRGEIYYSLYNDRYSMKKSQVLFTWNFYFVAFVYFIREFLELFNSNNGTCRTS